MNFTPKIPSFRSPFDIEPQNVCHHLLGIIDLGYDRIDARDDAKGRSPSTSLGRPLDKSLAATFERHTRSCR